MRRAELCSLMKLANCPMWPRNAGAEGSIIVGKLRESKDLGYGWNAQTNEFGDLYQEGVIDPLKVVRTALQDAASVAGLMVTTEAMVAEKPKHDRAAPL
jgi:chaperonin GroEL